MRQVSKVPHFRDENKNSERLSHLSEIPLLERGRTKTLSQDCLIPKSRLLPHLWGWTSEISQIQMSPKGEDPARVEEGSETL